MAKPKRIKTLDEGMDRKALLHALKLTRSAVDKSGATGIDQAQDFILNRDRVIAYNDYIAISAPLEMDTKLDLTVRAEDLYRVLQGIDDDKIKMDLDDDQLLVSSKNTNAWLAVDGLGDVLENHIDSMGINTLKQKSWQPLPNDFVDGLVLASFAASDKKENTAFHALYFDGRNVWATDDWRISRYRFGADIEFDLTKTLLPLGSVKELCKHRPLHVQQKGPWLHFKDGDGLLFSARTLDTPFPDCSKFLKVEGDPITLPLALAHALEAVKVFSPMDDLPNQEAEIEVVDGVLVCRAENDRGKIERRILFPDQVDRKKIAHLPKMKINPSFFIDVLNHAATITVDEGRALFSTKKFKHVMNLTALEK